MHTPRSVTKATPQLTPRTSRTNGALVLDPTLAYDPFIDAHVAVQDLEEKTRQASRALDLIEEAIKVTTEATDSAPTESGLNVLDKGPVLEAVTLADAVLIEEATKVTTDAMETVNILAGVIPIDVAPSGGTTPRGRTPTRGNTPPRTTGRAETERAGEHTAGTEVEAMLQMPSSSEPPQPPAESGPFAAPHPTIVAGVEEELDRQHQRRRDLSVGSVISTADSSYSVKGLHLHGC